MSDFLLSKEQLDSFDNDGFIALRGFYDLKSEIEPIQRHIHSILGLLIKKHNLDIKQTEFDSKTFDFGYSDIIKYDRKLGSVIYDAIKEIPAFVRLIGSIKNENLASQLMK